MPIPLQYKLSWNRDQLHLADQKGHTFTNFNCLICGNKTNCHSTNIFRTHLLGKQHRARAYDLNPQGCKFCHIRLPFRNWKELEDRKKSNIDKRELRQQPNSSKYIRLIWKFKKLKKGKKRKKEKKNTGGAKFSSAVQT